MTNTTLSTCSNTILLWYLEGRKWRKSPKIIYTSQLWYHHF